MNDNDLKVFGQNYFATLIQQAIELAQSQTLADSLQEAEAKIYEAMMNDYDPEAVYHGKEKIVVTAIAALIRMLAIIIATTVEEDKDQETAMQDAANAFVPTVLSVLYLFSLLNYEKE